MSFLYMLIDCGYQDPHPMDFSGVMSGTGPEPRTPGDKYNRLDD